MTALPDIHSLVDVHAHFVPDDYRAALVTAGHECPDGMPEIPEWSAHEHVAMMDRLGIGASLLSISSPGVYLEGVDAADLARAVNEAGRKVAVDHPGRFGQLASLPLPDLDATLAEIEYCCDLLGVDGFALLTNVGGVSVADPACAPVFDELDRRGARVFLHPTSPPCWEQTSFGRPRPMLEFFFETTRTVVELILNGTVAGHPGIEFVVPHAGAALAMVADRASVFSFLLDADPSVDVLADLGRLHYHLAGFAVPRQLDALRTLVDDAHLHYGSDFPFTPEFAVVGQRDQLATTDMFAGLAANTRRLFPTLDAPASTDHPHGDA